VMAERVPGDSVTARAPQVDWSQYTDGSWWRLVSGFDFDQTPEQAASAFRMYCWRRGLQANTRVSETDIRIRSRVPQTVGSEEVQS
jgi:hypothetical protein